MKIKKMVDWMNEGGADTTKLQIQYFGNNDRGVCTTCDIEEGETILFVPCKQVLTFEIVSNTSIAK